MALVPCKECGTLNSSEAEICLSCEHPIRGRRRTNYLKLLALILASILTLPPVLYIIDLAKTNLQTPSSQPNNK